MAAIPAHPTSAEQLTVLERALTGSRDALLVLRMPPSVCPVAPGDPRARTTDAGRTTWDFWLVGSDMDDSIRRQARQQNDTARRLAETDGQAHGTAARARRTRRRCPRQGGHRQEPRERRHDETGGCRRPPSPTSRPRGRDRDRPKAAAGR